MRSDSAWKGGSKFKMTFINKNSGLGSTGEYTNLDME